MLQTEFDFVLPLGYVDSQGNLHREGKMRRATALDEIAPMRDLRVRSNEAYLTNVLLARVITQLGTLRSIDTGVVEGLFSTDLAYLQDLYRAMNTNDQRQVDVVCPNCQHHFQSEVAPLGG